MQLFITKFPGRVYFKEQRTRQNLGSNEKYLCLPLQRLYVSSSLSEGRTEQFVPGFAFIVRACHIHPTGFYSLGLYCVELLFGHFGFSAYNMAAVTFSIKVMAPNSFLFLAIATNILVYKYNKKTLSWRGEERDTNSSYYFL
mmetsp:Transcript_15349/g.22217  ORF Transcript_15349/g.22217 Transcript_15349/m.22217 type:complete len:142 (+) Transcript_15349:1055-1480(+)